MSTTTCHIVHGQEFFLIDSYIENIQKKQPNASIQKFSDQFELDELMQACQSSGLFCSESIVLVKNPWFFVKKINDSELEKIISSIKSSQAAGITVLIYQYGNIDQRKKIVTQLKKVASIKKFEPFKDWEQDKFRNWLKQHLASLGKDITSDALQLFSDLLPNSLRAAANECVTLCTFIGDKRDISVDDIKAIATEQQLSTYDVLESLKKRKLSSVYKAIRRVEHMGEEPIRFLGLLLATFRQYTEILEAKRTGMPIDNLAKKTAKNPYFLKMLLKDISQTYTVKDAKRIFSYCADLDYKVKSGQVKANYIFQNIAQEICLSK